MNVLKTVGISVVAGMLAACAAASTVVSPSPTPAVRVASSAPEASPSPSSEASDGSTLAFVLSLRRDDGSYVAIPVSLDGQASEPIELGSLESTWAFRFDDRGVWVFAADQCAEVCAGTWSVVDPATGESTVLATDASDPLNVQVVDGVIYNTSMSRESSRSYRLDGKDLPWPNVQLDDHSMFSPNGTLVWRSTYKSEAPSEEQEYLFRQDSVPTSADELHGLAGSPYGWVDDTTMLLGDTTDDGVQGLSLFDTVTRTESPLTLPVRAGYVYLVADDLLMWGDWGGSPYVFSTLDGTVMGTVDSPPDKTTPQALRAPSGDVLVLTTVEGDADGATGRSPFLGARLFNLTAGTDVQVTGLPSGSSSMVRSIVARS